MQCNECKWFVGNVNDHYGICKRYPANQNKTKADFCGEFKSKENAYVDISEYDKPVKIVFQEPTEFETPKRGRKPKNVD